jgi:hypothetical protein
VHKIKIVSFKRERERERGGKMEREYLLFASSKDLKFFEIHNWVQETKFAKQMAKSKSKYEKLLR